MYKNYLEFSFYYFFTEMWTPSNNAASDLGDERIKNLENEVNDLEKCVGDLKARGPEADNSAIISMTYNKFIIIQDQFEELYIRNNPKYEQRLKNMEKQIIDVRIGINNALSDQANVQKKMEEELKELKNEINHIEDELHWQNAMDLGVHN